MKKRSLMIIISLNTIFSTLAQTFMNSTIGSGGTTKYIDGQYYSHVIIEGTFSQNGMPITLSSTNTW